MSPQVFHKNQLTNLPDPVQRYFNLVLKEGQSYISYSRIKHVGQFKTGVEKDWIEIKGEQYTISIRQGFTWEGTTSMFMPKDLYKPDKGRLVVSLLLLFNVVNASDKHCEQGLLLRWLGESVLSPTNFLPSETLQWSPIDSKTAKITCTHKGLSLFFKITFKDTGEITEMETMPDANEKNLESWVIKVSAYKELSNVLIPTVFEVMWRLQKGDFSYAKFKIREIEYNNAENTEGRSERKTPEFA